MPSRRLSLDAIRAELAWMNETRDPNINAAAAIFGAVRKPDISAANAHAQLRRSSGRFDGSTTIRPAANTGGVELKRAATWSLDRSVTNEA